MKRRGGAAAPTISRFGRRSLAWTGRHAWGTFRAGLVDIRGLSRGTQALLTGGYLVVLLGLALVLLLELFPALRATLPRLQSPLLVNSPIALDMRYVHTSGPFWWLPGPLGTNAYAGPVNATIPLMLAAAIVCCLGWALLLTGASDCGRRVFLPVLALYGLLLQVLTAFLAGPSALGLVTIGGQFLAFSAQDHPLATIAFEVLALLLVAVPAAIYLRTHRSSRWRRHPLLEFLGWALTAPLLIGVIALTMPGIPALFRPGLPFPLAVELAYLSAIAGAWMGILLSVFFALDTVNLATELGENIAHSLRRRTSHTVFRWLAAALAILAAVAALLAYVSSRDEIDDLAEAIFLFIMVIFPPGVVAACTAWRLLAQRWTEHRARSALVLTSGWAIWLAAVLLATQTGGQDFVGFAASSTNVLPPGTLSIGLLIYGVLTFGARYAERDGLGAPRAGRMLVFLGTVLLVLATLLFVQAERVGPDRHTNQGLQNLNDMLFTVSVVMLAPCYFVWTLWRRRAWREL